LVPKLVWRLKLVAELLPGEVTETEVVRIERDEQASTAELGLRRGEPISTAFVESAVNEIIAKRMNKKPQMRWNRTTVQPFLDVSIAVLNDNLEDAFRHRYPGFRPTNDDQVPSEAA
jgi:hypothetical protein